MAGPAPPGETSKAELLDAPVQRPLRDLQALYHPVEIAPALAEAVDDLLGAHVPGGADPRAPIDQVVDRRARYAEQLGGGLHVPAALPERGEQLRLGHLRRL